MRLHPEVDLADPFWREQMFFSRLPAALSAVFQEDDLAECREQIEAQTAQLVPCKRARVILASRGRSEPRRKSGVARLSVPLFAHGRVLGIAGARPPGAVVVAPRARAGAVVC